MEKDFSEVVGEKLGESGSADILEGFPVFFYVVKNPLNEVEQKIFDFIVFFSANGRKAGPLFEPVKEFLPNDFLQQFSEKAAEGFSLSLNASKLLSDEQFVELKQSIAFLFKSFVPSVRDPVVFGELVLDRLFGFGVVGYLLRDSNLEEIMVNGPSKNVFVFHQEFGMCKTNLFVSFEELNALGQKIAATTNKVFDEKNPFLDGRLPRGDRVNVCFSSITPQGITLTIRKFTPMPLSIVNLIANNTVSSEGAAFLWAMVEGLNISPANVIITGGAGSGKTTTLNVLTSFINKQDRIITIEDPIELNIGKRDNWVQMETWLSAGAEKKFLMDDLLRNSFRMRPDRLIVGEVRGPEAQTLFVAMDIGHQGSMGTLHANSARETLLRLSKPPMDVPEVMIPLLDLIVVQFRMYVKGKGMIRRITQIAEVSSMEGKPLIANIFEWDRKEDKLKRTDIPSHLIEEFSSKIISSKKEVMREITVRKKILEWLFAKNIVDMPRVDEIIQRYYFDPQSVLELVLKDSKVTS